MVRVVDGDGFVRVVGHQDMGSSEGKGQGSGVRGNGFWTRFRVSIRIRNTGVRYRFG